MSELILCQGRIAALPYFIDSAELNIYTLEELCWYIEKNLYLLDRELMNEELISWIEKELKEEELSDKLRAVRRGEDSIYQFYMTILLGCGYCGKKELQECDSVLKSLRNKSRFQCGKIRADHYLSRGLYARSINEYRTLLQSDEKRGEPQVDVGNVWHNLGCAYAGLFLFAEAEECFDKASALNQSMESVRLRGLCRAFREESDSISEENISAAGLSRFAPEMTGSASEQTEPDKNMRMTDEDSAYERAVGRARELLAIKDTEGFYTELLQLINDYKREYRRSSQIV